MHTIETAVKQLGLPVKMKPLLSPHRCRYLSVHSKALLSQNTVFTTRFISFFYVVVLNYLKPVHIESKSTL